MKSRLCTFILALLLVSIYSCGTSTQTVIVSEDGSEEISMLDPYADSQEYDEDPFEGFPVVTGLSIPSNVGSTEQTPDEIFVSIEVERSGNSGAEIPGTTHYSVQITAATEESSAQRIAGNLEGEVDFPVFVDRVDEYWKVRVGAFEERVDAEACRDSLINLGYTDAWVTTREL